MQKSLVVYNSDGKIFFERDGKWLHPLFSLLEYLKEHDINNVTGYRLHDKIIGAAAAVLIIKMGFTKCHGELMSIKAIELLKLYRVEYSYDKLVDGILCKTEKMVDARNSIDHSFNLLIELYQDLH